MVGMKLKQMSHNFRPKRHHRTERTNWLGQRIPTEKAREPNTVWVQGTSRVKLSFHSSNAVSLCVRRQHWTEIGRLLKMWYFANCKADFEVKLHAFRDNFWITEYVYRLHFFMFCLFHLPIWNNYMNILKVECINRLQIDELPSFFNDYFPTYLECIPISLVQHINTIEVLRAAFCNLWQRYGILFLRC